MNDKHIRDAITHHFCRGDSAAVLHEVGNATGGSKRRSLDMLVFDLWPSRGLALHGIEIKVSRSDFRREVANGAKAEEVAQYCDYFSVAAPVGVVPTAELPKAWGLLEVNAQGMLKEVVRPTKTKARVLDRSFVAALVRAAGKPAVVDVNSILDKARKELYDGYEVDLKARLDRGNADGAKWRKLKEAVGKDFFVGDESLIRAVRYVLQTEILSFYNGFEHIEKTLKDALDKFRKATVDLPRRGK